MIESRIIRVFPRRTKATPTDPLAFAGRPGQPADPPLRRPGAAEVHVSCTFTWDVPEAHRLARAWSRHYWTVKVGGPACGFSAGDFTPGMYLADGYTITSRGCPNACGFCLVPQRQGRLRMLPIRPGWDILDNNLLACPRDHVEAVLDMLADQPKAARFTGGLEARRVRPWFARRLACLRVKTIYTAYDRSANRPHVSAAIRALRDGLGWSDQRAQRGICCYVLVGMPGDSIANALDRLEWVRALGARPFPMYYQPPLATAQAEPREWNRALRPYRRPSILFAPEKSSAASASLRPPLFAKDGEIEENRAAPTR